MFELLAEILRAELVVFLFAMGAFLVWGMLTGRIVTSGILSRDLGSGPSPNHIQLLITTGLAAGYYLLRVIETADAHVLPPIPEELLLFIAGSHAAFTGVRIRSLFIKERKAS